MDTVQAAIALPENFPLYVTSMTLTPYDNMQGVFHIHSCVEVAVILEGSGVYTVNGRAYPVSAGDSVVIHRIVPHNLTVGASGMTQLLVLFEPRLLAESADSSSTLAVALPSGGCVDRSCRLAERIRGLATEMQEEYQRKEIGYDRVLKAQLSILLTWLARCCPPEPMSSHRRKMAEQMQAVLTYMEAHYAEPITLAEMAERLHYSPTHFSAAFKAYVGVSFKPYLCALRIRHSVYWLENSDKTVVEIAAMCGFGSMSCFYSSFYKVTGRLPTDLRTGGNVG